MDNLLVITKVEHIYLIFGRLKTFPVKIEMLYHLDSKRNHTEQVDIGLGNSIHDFSSKSVLLYLDQPV